MPETVVVKLTAIDPNAAFTSTVLRMYIREAKFFDELELANVMMLRQARAAVDLDWMSLLA